MSYRAAQLALERMHQQEVLLFPKDVARFQSGLETLASLTFEQGEAQMLEMRKELSSNYGGEPEPTPRKSFAFANGLAVIPIHGSLLNRFSGSYGGATGYNFIRSQLRAALADDDVKGIVFDVNSPGGEAAGCFELADEIRASRDVKPSMALVDTLCASAAYALASAASEMSVVRSATVGSIGVLCMHADVSSLLENLGVKISLIHSGKHKVDGNPFSELPDDVRASIQANIDELRGEFVKVVAVNRDLTEKVVYDTEANVYRAKKSVDMGLADKVASVQDAVSTFITALSGASTTMEKSDMTDQTTAAAPGAQAAAAAPAATAAAPSLDVTAVRKAEKERFQGIIGSDEAKSNPGLANHLAFNTDMTVEQAKQTLAASAPAAAAPATTDAAEAATPNALEAAMAATANGQPVVEPGAAATTGEQDVLAEFDQARYLASGRKPAATA